MVKPATPISLPKGSQRRTNWLIAIVFTIGICVFGFGFAPIIGLLPSGWGIFGVFQFVLLVIGALLVSLMTVVTLQFWYQDRPQVLTTKRATQASFLAAVIAFVVVIASWGIKVGDFTVPQFPEWILLGLVVLSLQFALGTVTPKRRRRLLLLVETVGVFLFLFGFLTVDRGEINFESYLVVSGGASVLLLLFGGPIYVLGTHLSRLDQ